MQFNHLFTFTDTFFRLYWKEDFGSAPTWSDPWDFNCELPNNGLKGCYALVDESDEVIYVGVAIGHTFAPYKSKGAYQPGGLGARLKAYWKVDKEPFAQSKYTTTPNWQKVKCIRTIGFNDDHYWLAAALEVFLIDKLKPIKNSKHKAGML